MGLFLLAGIARPAEIVFNAAFQSSGSPGWTPFTTGNGTLGTTLPPAPSAAGHPPDFVEGPAMPAGPGMEAAGIQREIVSAGGPVSFSFGLSVEDRGPTDVYGGSAEMLFDLQPVAGYDFGDIEAGQILKITLAYTASLDPGQHSVAIEFVRPATSDNAPYQFVDDFQAWEADDMTAPEPSTFVLFSLGLLLVATRGRDRFTGRRIRPRETFASGRG